MIDRTWVEAYAKEWIKNWNSKDLSNFGSNRPGNAQSSANIKCLTRYERCLIAHQEVYRCRDIGRATYSADGNGSKERLRSRAIWGKIIVEHFSGNGTWRNSIDRNAVASEFKSPGAGG
jgi:hypothetical protein